MKSQNNSLADLLDFDTPEASQDILWSAGTAHTVSALDGNIRVELDFFAQLFIEEIPLRGASTFVFIVLSRSGYIGIIITCRLNQIIDIVRRQL